MNKGDYFLKQYREYLFSGYTFILQFEDVLMCEEGYRVIHDHNIVKPNESNKRKRYKPSDKVYVVEAM